VTALGLDALALLALALTGAAARAWIPLGTFGLSVIGLLLAAVALASGAVGLEVPLGLPGSGLTLAADGLSGFFLVLLFLGSAAASLAALQESPSGGLPGLAGALALSLLAADAFGLVLGLLGAALAAWTTLPDRTGEGALRMAGMAVFAALSLILALGLLAPAGPGNLVDCRFAAARAVPPGGWRAGAALLLALTGASATAGLAPLHRWLAPTLIATPPPAAALIGGAMAGMGLYILLRVGVDLAGAAPSLWWAFPVLAVGAGSAALGALSANTATELNGVLGGAGIALRGLMTTGIGVALAARALDLPPLAALALGGVLLLAVVQGVVAPLLLLAAGAVRKEAQTGLLHRLGGLVHRMPVTTGCVLAGAAGMAALPPGPGFAGVWLLLQSLLGVTRAAGLAVQTGLAIAMALLALAVGLLAAAMVRLIGVAFLGRPRMPRTAAAEEAGRPVRAAIFGLAAVTLPVGLFPAVALTLAGPALHLLAGEVPRGRVLLIAPQTDAPGYSAPGVAALLAVLGFTGYAVWRGRAVGQRRAPAWEGGFAAPPPWLPFGDPATQYGAGSFSHILRRTLNVRAPRVDRLLRAGQLLVGFIASAESPGSRRTLAAVLGTVVLFLLILAWVEAG